MNKEMTVDNAQHLTDCDLILSFQYELPRKATVNNKEYETR